MDALRRGARWIDRISALAGEIATYMVLFACLISAGNAAIRYGFSYSSNGWLEIQWYLFGGIVMLGTSQTLKMNEHVRVDLFYSSRSDRGRMWIDVLGLVLFFFPVMIFLTWLSIPFFTQSWRSGEMSNNAGGLIIWPAKLLLPIGFGLLTLQGLSELIKRILVLQGEMKLEVKYEKPVQ